MTRDKIKKAVLEVMEEILGLEQDDMIDNMDLNLVEEGIIDSLSSASMIMHLEDKLGHSIDMEKIETNDFMTANTIISAMERIIG